LDRCAKILAVRIENEVGAKNDRRAFKETGPETFDITMRGEVVEWGRLYCWFIDASKSLRQKWSRF
jgi:hypothetical protein